MLGCRSAVVAGLALASLVFSMPASAADALRVRVDWTPWSNQSPIHLANQKGLYEKHGLTVTVDDGNGSVTTVQIVGNGEYDVGLAAQGPMLIARSKGLPVKSIASFLRRNDIGLMVPADSGIKSPADLKGKKLAFTAGSIEAPFIDRFLAAGKLTRADVELLGVDASAKAGTYMAGRADAAFSAIPFLMPVVAAQRPSTSVNFADFGLQFPSFGLFATEKTIADKRDQIRRFVSVTAGTWGYILAGHDDDAVQAMLAARPQAKLNPAVLKAQLVALKPFVDTEATKGKPAGTMVLSDWKTGVDTLAEAGLVERSLDPAAAFTNDMIDEKIVAEITGGKL